MNKKRLISTSIIVLLSLVIGLSTFAIVKNINDKPPVVVDQNTSKPSIPATTASEVPVVQQSTAFKGVDTIHWARGSADIKDTQDDPRLVFNDDFESAPGPDLFVYLSPNEAGQDLGEFASLGNLQSNKGTQEYVLPNNYKDYKTVVIWCRAFSATFATADIR